MGTLNQFLIYDELPLWSAPFGLMLLDTIRLKKGMNILDIGCGGGFPMLEIAGRTGTACMIFGIDPSDDSINMIERKIRLKGIQNAKIIKSIAEDLPFENEFFDLIVANNGFNNVDDQLKAMKECFRVSKNGAQLVFTVNLPGTMIEFYELFEAVLRDNGMEVEIGKMKDHIFTKRKSIKYLKKLLAETGFSIRTINMDGFKLKYTDGTAFFNHPFIRSAFIEPWKNIVPKRSQKKIFSQIEEKLNEFCSDHGQLEMSVPYACFDCYK